MSNPVEHIDIDLKLLVNNVDASDVDKQVQKATDTLARRRKDSKVSLGTIDTKEAVDSVRSAIETLEQKIAGLDKKTDQTMIGIINKRVSAFKDLNRQLESVIRSEVRAQEALDRIAAKPKKAEVVKEPKQPKPPKEEPKVKAQEVSPVSTKKFELSQDLSRSTPGQKTSGLTSYINELNRLIAVNTLVAESEKAVEAEQMKALHIVSQYEAEVKKLNLELGRHTGNNNQTLDAVGLKQRAIDKAYSMLNDAKVKQKMAENAINNNLLSGNNNQVKSAYGEAITANAKVLKLQEIIRVLTGKDIVDRQIVLENHRLARDFEAYTRNTKLVESQVKAEEKLLGIQNALQAIPTSSLDASARLKAVKALTSELDKMFIDIAKGQILPPKAVQELEVAAKEARKLAAALEQASHVPEIAKASQNLAGRVDALKKFRDIRDPSKADETANERVKYDRQELKLLGELEHAQKVLLNAEEARYAKEKQLHERNLRNDVSSTAPVPVNRKVHLEGIQATRTEINKLSQELKGFDILLAKVTQGFGLFFRYAVVYKALGAVTQFFSSTTTEVLALDKALVNIKAVANATTAEMDTVSASILRIGENSHFSSQEVAGAAETLVQAGVKIGSLNAVLQSTTDLAAAAGAGVQSAAELVTTFMSVYKEATPDQIADSLKSAVNISKLSIGDLSTISNYLLSTGKAFNEDYKDTLAIAATLRNAGIKASTIATGSRQALTELLSPDPKALTGLKARYTALGKDLSTDTIKSLFQGFKNSRDPMAAALAELQQLGLDKLGDNELSRIFDTRSTNIIRTLVQQQDELKANRIAIDDAGSAAAGAKTQLESLSASAANLREVLVGGAFKTSESFIGDVAKDVTSLTHNIEALLKRMREVKAETGSTGVLPALATAASASSAALMSGRSVGSSLAVGAVAGGLSLTGHVNEKESLTGKVIDKVGNAVESVAGIALIFTILSKVATPLGKIAKVTGGLVSGLRLATPVVTAVSYTLAALGAAGAVVPTLLIAAVALWVKVYNRFTDSTKDLATLAAAQSAAISERIAERRKQIDDLKKEMEVNKSKQETTVKFSKSFTDLDEAIGDVTGGIINKQIKTLIETSKNVNKQIGSASLEALAKQVEDIAGKPVDRRAIATALQQRDTALAVSEATRSQLSREVQLAQDHLKSGSASERENQLVRAYSELDSKQATLLASTITTTDQAKALLELKKNLEKSVGDLTGVYEKEAEIAKHTSEIANDVVEETANIMRRINGTDKVDASKAKAELQAKILGFVAAGEVSLVEAMLFQAQGALDKSLLDAAKANKRAADIAPLNKIIQEARDKQKADVNAPVPLSDYVTRPVTETKANVDKAVVEKELDMQRKELIRMTTYEAEQISAGRTAEELKLVSEQRLTLQEKIKDNEQRLSTFVEGEVDSAETHKEMIRSLLLSEQRLKEASQKYADMQETQLSSVSEQIAAVQEITTIKLKQLKVEKAMLAEQLRKELTQEGNIDASGKTPEEMLKLLSTAKGQELVTKSAGIGDKYKELLDVVGKEVDTRREVVKDLNNIKVSSDKRKLKSLEDQLPEADKKVKEAEKRLQEATNQLANARQTLADSVAKQGDLKNFFDSALTELGGGSGVASKSELQSRLLAPTADEAKAVASDAQAAYKAGKLSKRDAKGIIEDAKTAAQDYQAKVIEDNTSAMIRAQNVQNILAEETNTAIVVQVELTNAIKVLTATLDATGNAQGRAIELLSINKVDPAVFGLQGSDQGRLKPLNNTGDLVNLGGLQAAGKASDRQPITFNLGGASVKATAEFSAVDQFANQLRWEESKKRW